MNRFNKELITELFLDSDSITTVNRMVVAAANVIYENHENVVSFHEALKEEYKDVLQVFVQEPTRKIKVNSNKNYVFKFTDEDYINKFKMRKSTVQALIRFLKEHTRPEGVVPLDKKVHIFIWLMTNEITFKEIGSLFGLQKSSVSYIFHEMAALLTEHRFNFISWPSVEEQHVTRLKVNSRFNFPNCVGFIDTCRFKVGSRRTKKLYLDTVVLQAVCDESLMFIDIHIGTVGKTKKSKVFKESRLSQELKNFVSVDNHILGDSEYKLKMNLITPFTTEELLTSEEMKFNEIHWKARSYIGHAFELLKERFRKLSHIDGVKPEAMESLICAACVLHNFILLHEGCPEIKEEPITCDDGITIDSNLVKTAIEKRQFLCNYINYIN